MARRSEGGSKVLGVLLVLGVWAALVGLRASFVVLFVVLLVAFVAVSRARPKVAGPGHSSTRTGQTSPELEAAVTRLSSLAGELAAPGGRSRDEVVRDAAEVYASLPAHVRDQIARTGPGSGSSVQVSGPFGPQLARLLSLEESPAGPAPQAAPPTAATPAPTATPAPAPAALTPTPTPTPTSVVAQTGDPVPGGDVRYSVLAPDELTGDSTTPPGSVTEGWYITADRTRERWHNGSSWTDHVRVRGRA